MNQRLLIATTNPGKVREIRAILAGVPETLLTLSDFPSIVEPEETERTFAANALLKARHYAAAAGVMTVGEDSGLVIDALGGRPGVESAKYPGATYGEKFANLFRELEGHPRPWTARFVCSLALVAASTLGPKRGAGPGAEQADPLFLVEAKVEGEITTDPRGENGFGYDPIFYYPPYGGTLAEQDDARKLAVAHRGRAFEQLRAFLIARRAASSGGP